MCRNVEWAGCRPTDQRPSYRCSIELTTGRSQKQDSSNSGHVLFHLEPRDPKSRDLDDSMTSCPCDASDFGAVQSTREGVVIGLLFFALLFFPPKYSTDPFH